MDWKDTIEKNVKGGFAFGIVAAILMVVIGIMMLVNPAASLHAIVWVLIFGMIVAGVFRLVSYAKMPYWIRQGYTLVIGIIDLICGVMLAVAATSAPLATDEVFGLFIGLMFAFDMMFAGCNMLAGTGIVKRMGGSTGWLVASGILMIIASVLLLMVPMTGTVVLMFALAFALIVGGFSLLTSAIDLRNRAKTFKEYADQHGTDFDPENDPFFRWKMH